MQVRHLFSAQYFLSAQYLRIALSLATCGLASGTVAAAVPSDAAATKLLVRYCVDCHGPESAEAEIDLSDAPDSQALIRQHGKWKRVRDVVLSHQMPPEGEDQPSVAQRKTLHDWVDRSLREADWEAVKHPGVAPLARLTREQYQATVNDLFGIQVDLSGIMPRDPEGLSGFSNDRLSMAVTPNQFERLFKAAEVVAAAVLDSAGESSSIHYEVESGENANFNERPVEDDDGSRGWKFSPGLGRKYQFVRKTIEIPLTGTYRIRTRARSTGPGPAAGFWIAADGVNDASREAGVLVEGREYDTHETKMFLTAGSHEILFGYDFYRPQWLPEVPERPSTKLGQSTFDPPPYDQAALLPDPITLDDLRKHGLEPVDNHVARARDLIATINDGYFPAVLDHLMLNQFHYSKGYLPVFIGGLSYEYQVTVAPAFGELATLLATDSRTLQTIWRNRETPLFDDLRETLAKQRAAWRRQNESRKASVGGLMVDWIEFESMPAVENPHRLPANASEVRPFLRRLLPSAFGREASLDQTAQFEAIYADQTAMGASHEEAVERLLIAILVSPGFVYRMEGEATAGIEALDAETLASRISYFLWSSIPDAPLAMAAQSGSLDTVAEVDRHVNRMLRDDRIRRFARTFSQQWLDLADLGLEKEPDKELFRYFSMHLADDMREEIAMQLERILRQDLSVLELLDSRSTFLNERLARLYGIEGVTGNQMRLVTLPGDNRGGLLGTAGVLTTTSLATRTSPVRRGQFILETMLGVELPPPPPGVPTLDEQATQSGSVSLRERLSRHRNEASCAGCHGKIDPLGFALEKFDWIGRSRTHDPAGTVDSRGKLPDGASIDGMPGLKRYLVEQRSDDFVRALAECMLAYALGRELKYYDEHAIRVIVDTTKQNDYSAQSMVRAIVGSYPFRFRADAGPDWQD